LYQEIGFKILRLRPKDRTTAIDVYNLIHGDDVWQKILNVILVSEPLVKVTKNG